MFKPSKTLQALAAVLALSVACVFAEQASAQSPAAPVAAPELAGAWYQVYFDTNSVAINARGQAIVQQVAYVVANAGPTRVTVIGKTDRVGAPPANMALSMRRADAVRDALIATGVPAANIDTSWTGEARQQVATANDINESRNRVVDVTVVKQVP